jgi:hypothetical protein
MSEFPAMFNFERVAFGVARSNPADGGAVLILGVGPLSPRVKMEGKLTNEELRERGDTPSPGAKGVSCWR